MPVICVMAKVPVVGRVKTRLCPPLTPAQATDMARALLCDTWAVTRMARARAVLSYAGEPAHLPAALTVPAVDMWPQAPGDLGARMEATALRALRSAGRVALIGCDAPGLSPQLFDRALAMLSEFDAVLGPALDGGYYLFGVRRCEPGLLADLPWSAPDTLRATYRRLRRCGYSVALLPAWFDVDDQADLALLRAGFAAGLLRAPATERVLAAADR